MEDGIEYHLSELEIALDRQDLRRCMPDIEGEGKAVLDLGCGIGQLFIANNITSGGLAVGIDIAFDALRYGRERYRNVYYINADINALPLRGETFDMIVSRVSLPYTNIPNVIREIGRILKKGGSLWLSLHPPSMEMRHLWRSIATLRAKDIIFRSYVVFNGISLHTTGRIFPFPFTRRYESFQTVGGMKKLLIAAGFKQVDVQRDRHFVVTAVKE